MSGPAVVGLDATDASVAEAIRSVMFSAYTVEAALLGVEDFPPLRRTTAQIATSDARFFGIRDGDELVAAIEIERPEPGRVHLGSLVVRPSHVRRGLASALLRSVIDAVVAGAGDVTVATVDTGAANGPALGLYAAHGFVVVGRWTTDEGGIPMVALRLVRR